ncbi:MAG: leucine-rich repeat domain-containing protein [Clostridia bacterium]|nr:leucine-rich repeat domain-containing protein [Clostridia bacterium]
MKRKGFLWLLCLILCVTLLCCFVSCEEEPVTPTPDAPPTDDNPQGGDEQQGGDENQPHEHVFGNWTVIKKATCGAAGQSLRLCSCGEREYQTEFATGMHLYGSDNRCVVCKNLWEYFEGLEYVLSTDGLSYTVTGYFGDIGEELILPCFYNNLPVTAIGEGAFRQLEELKEVHLTDYITVIGAGAFEECASLTTVVFEKNSHLTAIGARAFAKTGITLFEIPAGVVIVGDGAFAECTALEELTVAEGNSRYVISKNGSLVDRAGATLLRVGSTGEIPTDVTVRSIAAYAFAGCGEDEIKISGSVTEIAPNAFVGCKSTKVTFTRAENWLIFAEKDAIDGTAVDVTDSAKNMAALLGDYRESYWYYIESGTAD